MSDAIDPARLRKRELLRAAYRAELPQRIQAIESGWAAVQQGRSDLSAAEDLLRHVHSLAGSAGTFGLPWLGDAARALELTLQTLGEAGRTLHAHERAMVDSAVASLRTLAQRSPEAELLPCAPEPPPGEATPSENRLIYLIEDDALVAEGLAAQLVAFGWDVRPLPGAAAASAALQEKAPAAVIVDVSLPEGRHAGPELIGRMQAASQSRIPHIAISSRWDWDSRLAAARSGADAYLVKPVDLTALVDRLDVLTRRRPVEPYRVLIVDDMTTLASYHAQVLGDAGMHTRVVDEPARLLDVLAEFNPELILMDLYMPDCTGIEAARVVRQDAKFTSLPIAFLSTESGRAQQLAAMQTGADDFLQKPISDAELVVAVSVRAARFRSLGALIRQDSLTGLLNHTAFKSQLDTELARVHRSGQPMALAMLDIDHFKQVNDGHGHPTGDRVIRALAQLLRSRLRRSDLIGRYGGEEFAVLMPGTPQDTALSVIDGLREQFAKIRFASAASEAFLCSFSAGVAAVAAEDDVDSLVGVADAALYAAKRGGRNRVCAASRGEQPEAAQHCGSPTPARSPLAA